MKKTHPSLLAVLLGSTLLWGCSKPSAPRTVILISLDTLRPDHLSAYGYGRDTSPTLRELVGDEAARFDNAYAQAPYTLPSHMSLMTGLYPLAHGVTLPHDEQGRPTRLADEVVTLAESLGENGFDTAAFTDGGFVDSRYGFDQGFAIYEDQRASGDDPNGFRRFLPAAFDWLRQSESRDAFLFLHTFDTHSPYDVPEPFASKFLEQKPGRTHSNPPLLIPGHLHYHDHMGLSEFDELQGVIDKYDGCIAYVDDELRRLIALLKELGRWENTLLIITSDHGEAFLERGFMIGHGMTLYEEEVRIPLIIRFPNGLHGGVSIDHLIESVDVVPTVHAALDLPMPEGIDGQNLLAGLEDETWQKDHAYGVSPNTGHNSFYRRGSHKLVEAIQKPWPELVRWHLQPANPLGTADHGTPYRLGDKVAYYNFEQDPLDAQSFFAADSRVYDLARSPFESESARAEDATLQERMSRLTQALTAQSLEKQPQPNVGEEAFGEDHQKTLESLGYVGTSRDGTEVAVPTETNKRSIPPPPNRKDLDRGDALTWRLGRRVLQTTSSLSRKECLELLSEARASYQRFLSEFPDQEGRIQWRLDSLDVLELALNE